MRKDYLYLIFAIFLSIGIIYINLPKDRSMKMIEGDGYKEFQLISITVQENPDEHGFDNITLVFEDNNEKIHVINTELGDTFFLGEHLLGIVDIDDNRFWIKLLEVD
jgi:hypothetical protein